MTNGDYKTDVIIDQLTRQYINEHRTQDVKSLALHPIKGVDMPLVLDQIQGWQMATKKLPSWAAKDGIIYPPHLNMEQCSSEQTARYKGWVVGGKVVGGNTQQLSTFVDLTGGFGVDFAFIAPHFHYAVYVERNERLCAIARHNFKVLGLHHVEVVCGDGVDYLHEQNNIAGGHKAFPCTTIYLDPARRDANGKKVFGIEDCTPDVLALKDELLSKADTVMIKLSPMLDWHEAVRKFGSSCREVHIVSMENECKELLLILSGKDTMPLQSDIKVVCVNNGQTFSTLYSTDNADRVAIPLWRGEWQLENRFLYIPNASVMKAGVFSELTKTFPVFMIDKNSHLFISSENIPDFPGRKFIITATTSMNKHELKEKLYGIKQANIATRNFPMSANELRKRLKLKDGGDAFLFATTQQGKHIILIAKTDRN